jgi:hypothetical protein
LRGLTLNSSGVGSNGIVLNSGGSLTVTDCVMRNFTGDGVAIQPASGTTTAIISNTYSLNNGANGIIIRPTGSASVLFSIDQTTASKSNSNGIDVDAGASAGHANGMITNSHADYNSVNGIAGIGATGSFNVWIHVKNSFAIGNNAGLLAQNTGVAVGPFSGAGIIFDNDCFAMNNIDLSNSSSSIFTFGNNYWGASSGSATTTSHK